MDTVIKNEEVLIATNSLPGLEEIKSSPETTPIIEEQVVQEIPKSTKSKDEDDSSSDSDTSLDEGLDSEDELPVAAKPPHTKNEIIVYFNQIALIIQELPPVEKYADFIEEKHKIDKMGKINHHMGASIVIKSDYPHTLDIDSILCTENRKFVGRIEDVIGPVFKPFYIVRFNSEQEAREFEKGSDIFYVTDLSQFVRPTAIKDKGSDASGNNDEEPDPDEIEFSDDEEERRHKQKKLSDKKQKKFEGNNDKKRKANGPPNDPQPSPRVAPQTPQTTIQTQLAPYVPPKVETPLPPPYAINAPVTSNATVTNNSSQNPVQDIPSEFFSLPFIK